MSSAATTLSPIHAAMVPVSQGSLVVSVHDIAPSSREVTEKIVSELLRRGVTFCSLLVVPNYHHAGSITTDRELGIWLRELESRGIEIVIHGYFHERPRCQHESAREKFITRFYTSDEGEFYDLDYEEAFRRITQAREEFATVGLSPRGFIAPAWLLNSEGERAAADAGMEYTTRIGSVRDLRSRKDFPARSLVYSVRNSWRRVTSLAWNSTLFLAANQRPLLRLSIHPPDYSHPEIWGQIVRFVDQVLAGRTATTYAAWIDEQRAQRNSCC
jgi:predicted deacetylase